MNGNYIKISRSMLEWEWYRNINTKVLFLHMLLKANWKDGKFEGKTVPRGSFISSIRRLADETSLTEREIRTSISHLKATGEVTSNGHSKYSVFTVVKYNLYQTIDTQNDNQETSERHSNDILTTTIEEGKKERRKERKNNPLTPLCSTGDAKLDSALDDFIEFRKGIKKPMTERAVQLAIKQLNKISQDIDIQIAVIEQSILRGWQGLFPLKEEYKTSDQVNDPVSEVDKWV